MERPADISPRNRKWPSCVNTSSSMCRFRISATSISSITVFYQWQKAFFENGTTAFESRRPRSQSLFEEEDKIAALEIQAQKQDRGARRGGRGTGAHKKRAWGKLSGRWIAHDTADNVIDFIKRLSARTEISPLRLVGWMELSRSKYYEWRDRYGKADEHNVLVPRDHWLEEWEKDAIIGSRWRGPSPAYLHDAGSRHRGGESLEHLPPAQGRGAA
jgi:hypothetical protein